MVGGSIPNPDKFADRPTTTRFQDLTNLIKRFLDQAAVSRQPPNSGLLKLIRQNAANFPSEMKRATEHGEPLAIGNLIRLDLDETPQANTANLLFEICGLNGRELPKVTNETLTALTTMSGGLPTVDAGPQAYNPVGKPPAYRVLDEKGQTQGLVLGTKIDGAWLQLTGSAITDPKAGDRSLNLALTMAVAPKP